MKHFFLFQQAPDPAWSQGRRAGFWAWNLGMVLASGVGLGLCSLLLAVGPYSVKLIQGYFLRPVILALNLLPVLALILLIYGLSGRAGFSFLLTAGIVLGLSLGNYYKLMFRNDPLMFPDLLLLKEAGNMAGKYKLFLDKRLIVALLCVLAGWLFLHFLVRGRPAGRARIACSLAGAAWAGLLVPSLLDNRLYNGRAAYYELLDSRFSATQQYVAHGFVYPFLHSVSQAIEAPPQGYDAAQAAALLERYEDGQIPEDQKVNIIGIMLEAYNDFTKFGTPKLARDVYEVWHDLEAEGCSGDLVTNIFAGGTVDTERCFLTGYSDLNDYRGNVNSYVWYLRSQGYRAEGMHPCYDWFYNRRNVNAYLGFENYFFVENYFSPLTNGQVGSDDIFFPELIRSYEAAKETGEPYFSFSVTYQGHGPYGDSACWWGEKGDYVVEDGTYTESEQYILDNYFGSVYNTNQHLKELTDYLREDDAPAILILFGDHDPWMGDGNALYEKMGVNLDLSTEEGFYNYYATRYIIWANDAAKEALGRDFTGEGPAVSPNHLMGQLFELCGWEGPAYMQAARAVKEQVPVINNPTGLYLEKGVLTQELSQEGQELMKEYRALQYYCRKHFRYQDVK